MRRIHTLCMMLCTAASLLHAGVRFSTEAKNNYQLWDEQSQTMTILFSPQTHLPNIPFDEIDSIYTYGTITLWNATEPAYRLEQLSDDSCYYGTFQLEQINRPGNSGQPEFLFLIFGHNADSAYVIDSEYEPHCIEHVDPRLIGYAGLPIPMLLLPGEDINEVGASVQASWIEWQLADWDIASHPEQEYQIANFRLVPGTRNLYRSYHPFAPGFDYDTEYLRLSLVSQLCERHGIQSDITLTSNQEHKAGQYYHYGEDSAQIVIPAYYQSLKSKGNILYVGTANGVTPSYKETLWLLHPNLMDEWVTEVVRFIIDERHPAPFNMHCSYGAERTGAMSAVLAALCGASWQQIAEDFEATGNIRLRTLYRHRGLIRYCLERLTGERPDQVADLQAVVRNHFINNHLLSADELDALVQKLNTPTDTTIIPDPELVPHVSLTLDAPLQSNQFCTGTFQMISTDTTQCRAEFRRRGSSSLGYDKPTYAVKLYDETGIKMDSSLLGMRSDNYWVLDAMAIDKARMRNRINAEIYRAMGSTLYYADMEPKAKYYYDGQMVDVWTNEQRMGLYCLMERMDRKQLKLKKYSSKNGIRGVLYKASSWLFTEFAQMPTSTPSTDVATWEGWEVEYPDLSDGEPITWDPMYNLTRFITTSDRTAIADSIDQYIDLPMFIDYVLLSQVLYAKDNGGKNTYWACYDQSSSTKLTVVLWDMDYSWGRTHLSTPIGHNYLLFSNHGIHKKLRNYYPNYTSMLEKRYAELRQTAFSEKFMFGLLDYYFTLYRETGMDDVENQLWSGHNDIELDIASEQAYMRDWMTQRLAYLDKYFHYTPIITDAESQYPMTKDDAITIVYDIYGRIVSHSPEDVTSPGLYLIRRGNVVEKQWITPEL